MQISGFKLKLKLKYFQLTFPAVTICNSNRVSCSQLKKTYEELDAENDTSINFERLSNITKLSSCDNINELTTTLPAVSRRKRSIEALQKGLGDTPDFLKTEYKFLESYMGLDESIRLKIGHQFSDFVKKCTFSGSDCLNIRSFILFPLCFLKIFLVTLKWLQAQLMVVASQSTLICLEVLQSCGNHLFPGQIQGFKLSSSQIKTTT